MSTVSGVENQVKVAEDEGRLCDPKQALEFVDKTGIDIFAPAIGTAHGVYKTKNPKIDFERFEKIAALINGREISIPLVVHGGTGLQPDVVKTLVSLGGAKFNVSTDLKHTLIDTTYDYITNNRDEYNPGKIDYAVRAAIKDKIKQNFKTDPIRNIPSVIRSELMGIRLNDLIRPGETVAITAGSRGIANIDVILKTIVEELTLISAKPFIIPAMGSHGGGTAEGQLDLIGKYGITPEKMGIPVKSDMAVVQIGETLDGLRVYLDRYAHRADHIVVVNRIKPHTDFTGDIESGLIKMMAIGLGKQKGAELYHKAILHQGYYNVVLSVGREVLKKCPVAFGLALVENQKDETQIIRAMRAENIEQTEKELLVEAKRLLPTIPFSPIDLLIVDQMGKDISGTGMDQNIIARTCIPSSQVPDTPEIFRIFVRDFSDGAGGNAIGIGNADFTTRRLVEKIDREVTYMNGLTSNTPENLRIPPYFDTDQEAIETAISVWGLAPPNLCHSSPCKARGILAFSRNWIVNHRLRELRGKNHIHHKGHGDHEERIQEFISMQATHQSL